MEQKENIFKLLSGNSNLRSCKRETFELLVDSLQNSNVGFSRCIITICASEGKNNTVKQKTNVKMKYQKYKTDTVLNFFQLVSTLFFLPEHKSGKKKKKKKKKKFCP